MHSLFDRAGINDFYCLALLGINCIARRTLPLSAQSISLQLGRHPTRPLAFLVTGKPPPLPNHVVNLVLMPASASATAATEIETQQQQQLEQQQEEQEAQEQ